MSFSFKSIRVGLSIAVIFVLFLFIDTKSLLNVVAEIKIGPLLVSLACILLSQYLSSIRFYFILRDNNINVPRSDAFRANIYGLVGGMMLLNLLGQGLTRSVVLHRFQVPQSTIFLLTALERLAALFVLLAAAVIGLALVFRRFPISFNEDALILVRYAVAGSCTLIFVVLLGLTARQRRLIRQLAGQIFSFATLRLIGITVLMHGAMLASYIIIAKSLRPQLEIISTTAASVVVMFVASLPISFAGWGFRELSAAFAFARIGLTPEQGVLIGVTIGVLSILSLVGNAAWVGFRRIRTGSPKEALPRALIRGDSLERISYWLIGIGASVAAFFQILVPTNSGHLNVNLGDPFAIVGGLVLASIALRMRSIDFFWRVRSVVLVLGAVTTVLAIGLLNGYLAYGPIHWAI
ncbi:MAG: lysylphosphatidylglycerol synthase transmembrane domain-containing protein, partial [Candidatus Binatia bacterium]